MRGTGNQDDEWMAERAEWVFVPVAPKAMPIRRARKLSLRGKVLAFLASVAIWVVLGRITLMLVKWIP